MLHSSQVHTEWPRYPIAGCVWSKGWVQVHYRTNSMGLPDLFILFYFHKSTICINMLLDYLPQAAHWALARRASKFFGLCEAADPCLISVLVVYLLTRILSPGFFLFHLSHTYDLSFKTCPVFCSCLEPLEMFQVFAVKEESPGANGVLFLRPLQLWSGSSCSVEFQYTRVILKAA